MAEAEHFFSRWSRRKVAVAQGVALPEPAPAVQPLTPSATTVTDTTAEAAAVVNPSAHPHAPEPAPTEAPPLTMDDVAALTTESDFKPFVARDVAPEVRNAAMKTLFKDPHYNVMDRMDIYIDDYSQPDPLPEAMLRQMASAQFLGLFEDQPAAAPAAATAGEPGANPDTPLVRDVTQSSVASPQPEPTHHAHADLRLQPHPAAVGPEPGQSAERNTDPAQRAVPT